MVVKVWPRAKAIDMNTSMNAIRCRLLITITSPFRQSVSSPCVTTRNRPRLLNRRGLGHVRPYRAVVVGAAPVGGAEQLTFGSAQQFTEGSIPIGTIKTVQQSERAVCAQLPYCSVCVSAAPIGVAIEVTRG